MDHFEFLPRSFEASPTCEAKYGEICRDCEYRYKLSRALVSAAYLRGIRFAMNGAVPKKKEVRKLFVRNSITPARPCEVVQKKHVQFIDVEDEPPEEEERDFSSPEFCSVLKLAEEIRKIQIHPNSQLKKRELSHFSRQFNVNFEPDEKLYQDLISLEKPDCDAQLKVKISAPKCCVKKDPELDLKKILQYSLKEDYIFTRLHVPEIDRPQLEFDGFSVYRHSKRYMTYNNY